MGELSETPTEEALRFAFVFDEPLLPLGGTSSRAENHALAEAIVRWRRAPDPLALEPFEEFLREHPQSVWRPAMEIGLGIVYRHTGRYDRALRALESAWSFAKNDTSRAGRGIADRAAGELADLLGRLGHTDRLRDLLRESQGRAFVGSAARKLQDAWHALVLVQSDPASTLRCGPVALEQLHAALHPHQLPPNALTRARATPNGTNLQENWRWSVESGLRLRRAFRAPGAEVLTPAMVHWRSGHFAALVGAREESPGRVNWHVRDPSLQRDAWVHAKVLDEEASGYMLVDASRTLPPGWREVDETEAATVWGKGPVSGAQTGFFGPADLLEQACRSSLGMARHGFHGLLAALHVEDTPVWSHCPFGPSVAFQAAYNQADSYQDAIPSMASLGPRWSYNWRQYIRVIASSSGGTPADFEFYLGGGGVYGYKFPNPSDARSRPDPRDQSVLERDFTSPATMPPSFVRLRRVLLDGTVEHYEQSTGGIEPRFLLTRVADPQGNEVELDYDPTTLRLNTITDASGQVTTLQYVSNVTTDAGYYLINGVSAPGSRSATFTYVTVGGVTRLASITDMRGIVSSFAYRSESRGTGYDGNPPPGDPHFLYSLTTPYGTTTFTTGWSAVDAGLGSTYYNRWVESLAPDGGRERVSSEHSPACGGASPPVSCVPDSESIGPPPSATIGTSAPNAYFNFRNTLYWNTRAYARALQSDGTFDSRYARIVHWLHGDEGATGVVESEVNPGENRTYYTYLNQWRPFYIADPIPSALPITIARKLGTAAADNSESVYRFTYNPVGKVASMTDPVGRTTFFDYHSNQIDLYQIRQATSSATPPATEVVYQVASYDRHLPTDLYDPSNARTQVRYNRRGQVQEITRPDSQTVTFIYDQPISGSADTEGRLLSASGPGGVATFTWNARNLVHTATDPEGVTRTFTYDALDRVERVDYADGSSVQVGYQLRDPVTGALLTDSMGQPRVGLEPTTITDRDAHTTSRAYDALHRLTRHEDPSGNVTRYNYCCGNGLSSITNARGYTTTFNRDSARFDNRVTKIDRADGTSVEYQFNHLGQLSGILNARGQSTNFSYAPDGQVTTISAGALTRWFSYNAYWPRLDEAGITHTSTGTETHAAFTWRPVGSSGGGSVESVDGPWVDDTLTWSYDTLGRRYGRTLQTNLWQAHYDTHDRIDWIEGTLGRTNYTYPSGSSSLLQRMTVPGGAYVEFAHDTATYDRRLSLLVPYEATGTALDVHSYTWYASGRLLWHSTWTSLRGHAYLPNGTLQYTTDYDWGGSSWVYRGYSYQSQDANRNLYEEWYVPAAGASTLETFSHDAADRLTSQSNASGTLTVSSDADGNVTSDGEATYTWNAFNQLTSVVRGGHTSLFTYDVFGRLLTLQEDGTTRRFLWDGTTLIEERDASNNLVRRYYLDGFEQDSKRYFYLRDQLGSVIGLYNDSGGLIRRWSYSLWGARSLVWAASGPSVDSPIGFAGYFYHGLTGLYLTPTRAYHPGLRRWLSRDPLGMRDAIDGTNLYAYAAGDPVNNRDPGGQVIDTLIDAASIAYDLYSIYNDFQTGNCGAIRGDLTALGLDILGAAIPGVTGLGAGAHLLSAAERGVGRGLAGGERLILYHAPKERFLGEIMRGGFTRSTHPGGLYLMERARDAGEFSRHYGGGLIEVTVDRSYYDGLRNSGLVTPDPDWPRGGSWIVSPSAYHGFNVNSELRHIPESSYEYFLLTGQTPR